LASAYFVEQAMIYVGKLARAWCGLPLVWPAERHRVAIVDPTPLNSFCRRSECFVNSGATARRWAFSPDRRSNGKSPPDFQENGIIVLNS